MSNMSEVIAEQPVRDATGRNRTGAVESSSQSLSDVVRAGDLVASLEALRDEIAADLEACQSMRDKAPLYMRLVDVLARIEDARPIKAKGDAVDEIAARRSARRSGTSAYSSRANDSG